MHALLGVTKRIHFEFFLTPHHEDIADRDPAIIWLPFSLPRLCSTVAPEDAKSSLAMSRIRFMQSGSRYLTELSRFFIKAPAA